jgi:plastocyanin
LSGGAGGGVVTLGGSRGRRKKELVGVAAVAAILIVATVAGLFYYNSITGRNAGVATRDDKASYTIEQMASSHVTVIVIPRKAATPPANFNVTELLTNKYAYPVNITVFIGVNNTIEWLNADSTDHTVSSFAIPSGAQSFSSGLIPPHSTFNQTLTIPGVYKYTCIWHPWLAGEITVVQKAAA